MVPDDSIVQVISYDVVIWIIPGFPAPRMGGSSQTNIAMPTVCCTLCSGSASSAEMVQDVVSVLVQRPSQRTSLAHAAGGGLFLHPPVAAM